MKRALLAAMAVAALVALAGCQELLRPGFPHRAHLTATSCGEEGQPPCPTCISCHEPVRTDGEARPDEATCRRCHGAATATVLARVRFAPDRGAQGGGRAPIVFSHRTHLGQPQFKGQCVECHAGVADDGARGDVFPKMADCLGCHEDGLQADKCTMCHERGDLHTLVPQTFLRHDTVFFRNHGAESGRHEGVCNQCHAESFCTRCHDQEQPIGLAQIYPEATEAPFIHRADFLVRHAIEARSTRDCARCHTTSYCDSCHIERGISANLDGSINPHPIGWVGPDTGSPDFHGRAARRDIVACAACHEAGPATNCIRCHRVGGPGGNPHPSGWRSFRSPKSEMCSYCHVP